MPKTKIKDFILEKFPVLTIWAAKAKEFTMPGFDGIPLYDIIVFFRAEIRANSLSMRSKAVAFSFFLALFPALTFVFTLIPYLPFLNDIDVLLLNLLQQVVPNEEIYNFIISFIEPLLNDLANKKRGGLLTGSFFLVMMLMSNGVMAIMSSFDKSYDDYDKRNALLSRFVAFKITFLLMFLFVVSATLIVLGPELLQYVISKLNIQSVFTKILINMARLSVLVLTFFFALSLIYHYGPATKKKYKFISTGATVATILSILVSMGFSYWVSNFNKLNVIFGSIGTLMLLMIWLNINSFVLLIGYEINASIRYNKTLRTKELEIKGENE